MMLSMKYIGKGTFLVCLLHLNDRIADTLVERDLAENSEKSIRIPPLPRFVTMNLVFQKGQAFVTLFLFVLCWCVHVTETERTCH